MKRTLSIVTPTGTVVDEGPKPDLVHIQGDKLRDMRRAAGITQCALARQAGIDQTVLSSLERGLRGTCPIEVAERLAAALESDWTLVFNPNAKRPGR